MVSFHHNQPNLYPVAQQGNAIAIALLLNRQLESKGITAKATVTSDCLKLMVESAQIPPQQLVVEWLKQNLKNMGLTTINTVIVYGRKNGRDIPDWQGEFALNLESNLPSFPLESRGEDAPLNPVIHLYERHH